MRITMQRKIMTMKTQMMQMVHSIRHLEQHWQTEESSWRSR